MVDRDIAHGFLIVCLALATTEVSTQQRDGNTAQAVTSGVPGPRTLSGRPDLQGNWDFRTVTPMERPESLADKAILTEQEAQEFASKNRRDQDVRDTTPSIIINGAKSNVDLERAYNDFWWDYGKDVVRTRRTSLVIDPPNGRIPPLTADGQQRALARRQMRERPAQGPEDRGVGERCILGFNAGPPFVPNAYNNNVQIVQTDAYVVLHNEMVHNARIIPLEPRPLGSLPQWNGESRGRWDGDTLVVETANFKGETAFQNSSENLRLVERFGRVDVNTLIYEFTVNDLSTWTRPWTVQIPMSRTDDLLYEYACHEGNYGMTNLLKGARFVERQGAGQATPR